MTEEKTPQDHAEEIAETVQIKGICIFHSELFGSKVAFIKDLRYKKFVPKDTVYFTNAELKELFGEGKPKLKPVDLKLIFEAKKAGGEVLNYEKQGELI